MGVAYSVRGSPPANSVVVEIESDECCTCETLVGRTFNAGTPKPPFVIKSDAEWLTFVGEMAMLVRSYRREGIGFIFIPLMFIAIICFHPSFGPIAHLMVDNQVGTLFMMLLVMVSLAGLFAINFTGRQFNQKVDARINDLLRRTTLNSGANFVLCTAWTGTCKPKGARTYRALWISPAAVQAVVGEPVMQAMPVTQPASSMMLVTVPTGVKPGDPISILAPDGTQLQVTVPPGVQEGGQFHATIPTQPTATVVVPIQSGVAA
mmetsp:Transcript_2433/g.4107  ORF Transcript_2433/g.4107 Transcript_2433/m.4107 type:complete len:263 (-) Transcript_2433:86-874(-)|eukprot:CAMPEP_0119342610 /NCGR_PEP_ID=MMETSP1333-20130426/105053_1 /TAXON_ID=418940 /ORGANISM="Scyphosphaera apsteinii, Strain RCC1455" /LENGTH=262 /DNA_ID=CAMNT_0007354857 /DNA_START=95 /DNA_END=883 /DNA_ORIENTATION=-